jgi:hypothetical protein
VGRSSAAGSGTIVEVRGAENVARRAKAFSRLGLVVRPALVNGAAGWMSLLDGGSSRSPPSCCRAGGSRPWTSSSTPRTWPASTSQPSIPYERPAELVQAFDGPAWLLVVGLAGHGFKDLWQHRRHYVANTRWWPPFPPLAGRVVGSLPVGCLVAGHDGVLATSAVGVGRVTERNRIGPVGTFPARFGRGRRNTPPLNEAGVFD